MSTEWQVKEQICEIGRRVWQREYVAANDGNFSVRIADNRVVATPTMLSKGFMQPEDLVVIDMAGNQLEGHRRPTSETLLHLGIYKERSDIKAVLHAHPPYATAFAVAQEPVPKCVLPEVEIFLGEIPITQYATPGSREFAESIRPFLKNFNLFLLANHGALAVGEDLEQAYYRMEIVDQYCRILLYARQLGGTKQITQEKMQELFQLKERFGIPDRRTEPGGDASCCLPSPVPGIEPPNRIDPGEPAESQEALAARIERIVRSVLQQKRDT